MAIQIDVTTVSRELWPHGGVLDRWAMEPVLMREPTCGQPMREREWGRRTQAVLIIGY
jgi:hypothetical protein